jgi:hypothetical protein
VKSDNSPIGIGGWLILPALGLGFTPLVIGIEFCRDILPALDPSVWRALTDSASDNYNPIWAPAIIFEVGSNVLLFAFALWLNYLFFFRKSARVPRLFIAWLACQIIFNLIDVILTRSISSAASQTNNEGVTGLARSIMNAAIWIPYFIMSIRVKNTFVRAADF